MPPNKKKGSKSQKLSASGSSSHSTVNSSPMDSALTVDRGSDFSSLCKWTITNFARIKAKSMYSQYFEVGGFDFRFLIYPKGDSLALPGHTSLYLQVKDPRGSNLDCNVYYKMILVNAADDKKSLFREGSCRFSKSRKSIGWCEFVVSKRILEADSGFLNNGALLVSVDIRVLNETISFTSDGNEQNCVPLNGKVTWTIRNYGLFGEMLRTQKLISSGFMVGDCNLAVNLYKTVVNGVEYLSLFLETRDSEKSVVTEKSCWCLFRISVFNQKPGLSHFHKDYSGRFGVNRAHGDDTSLGWIEYMKMSDFISNGFLLDDSLVIGVSFNAIKESTVNLNIESVSKFSTNVPKQVVSTFGSRHGGSSVVRKSDALKGKFVWRIENFVRLKDILKRKKMKGLCIRSRRFTLGNLEFRLLVCPRGQSPQESLHLSLFLEVFDPTNPSSDWSHFIFYRLAVANHKAIERSCMKQSQGRCTNVARVFGWPEFMTLTSLFDQDSGCLDRETAAFTAEVQILKDNLAVLNKGESCLEGGVPTEALCTVTWKLENIFSLKEGLRTGKIFSKTFHVNGCEFQIGIYESSDGTICLYLETGQSLRNDPEKNFWVSYRMTLVNQRDADRSKLVESSFCTRTLTSLESRFLETSDMMEPANGFVDHDLLLVTCEIVDCCPWFEFSEPDLLPFIKEGIDSSSGVSEENEFQSSKGLRMVQKIVEMFKMFLEGDRWGIMDKENLEQKLVKLKGEMKTGDVARCLVSMRVFVDDPYRIKSLIDQTRSSCGNAVENIHSKAADELSSNLAEIVKGIKAWEEFLNNGILDIMIECCETSNASQKVAISVGSSMLECSVDDHWPDPSEDLLLFLFGSLKNVKVPHLQLLSESMETHSVEKALILLENVPDHLQTELVVLLPKLLRHSNHLFTVNTLLCQLEPDKDPALQARVLATIYQLDMDNKGWEFIFCQTCQLLKGSKEEMIGAITHLIIKSATYCQRIPEAFKVVHEGLEILGPCLSPSLLDFLSKAFNECHDTAEAMLREIGSLFTLKEKCRRNPSDGIVICGHLYFSDIFMLIELLAIPSLAVQASQAFERGIEHEFIKNFSVALVLEWHTQRHSVCSSSDICLHKGMQKKKDAGCLYLEKVLTSVVSLAEKLLRSTNSQVLGFVKMLYATLSRLFISESCRRKILRGLVDHATNPADDFSQICLDILLFLVQSEANHGGKEHGEEEFGEEEQGDEEHAEEHDEEECDREEHGDKEHFEEEYDEQQHSKEEHVEEEHAEEECIEEVHAEEHGGELVWLILNMMKDVAYRANVDRKEKEAELSNMGGEKAILLAKLADCNAAIIQYQNEVEHITSEKKELEQFSSEKNEEFAKLSQEKAYYEDCFHQGEEQLKELKSQNHELRKVANEYKVLAERVRNAEGRNKKFEKELQKHASEVVAQKEEQKILLNEIQELKQKVQVVKQEKEEQEKEVARLKREKEKEIAWLKQEKEMKEEENALLKQDKKAQEEENAWLRLYARDMEANYQEHIQSLQNQLQEERKKLADEMLQHAPLYGYDLENRTMKELDILAQIHELGLQQIDAIRRQRQASSSLQ